MQDMTSLFHDTDIDLAMLDADGQAVLIAQVRVSDLSPGQFSEPVITYARHHGIPFFLIADLNTIRIYHVDDRASLIFEAPTIDVLSRYDRDFSSKRIFGFYLKRLIEAWLRDVAYHWKSEMPPCFKELSDVGLAQRVMNGTTLSESETFHVSMIA